MRPQIAAAILTLALPASAGAQESASFLKIGVGAKALGMGGAYAAIATDISAIAWNPAGLSWLSSREAGLMHAELAADARYDFLGYGHPTAAGVIGFSAARLSHGTVEGRDASGKPTGGFSADDTAVTLAFAPRMGTLRLGGGLKYIRSSIAEVAAQGYALDFGGLYRSAPLGPGTPQLGFSVQNLGPGMRFLDARQPLPLTVAAGAAYRLPAGLTLAADYRQRPYARTSEVSIGTEYSVVQSFAVRAGYASAAALSGGSGPAGLGGMAGGFGLKARGYSLDYAIMPMGELGNAHRLSLGTRF